MIRKKIAEIDPKLKMAIIPKSLQQFYLATASDHNIETIALSKAHQDLRQCIADIKQELFPKAMECLEQLISSFEEDSSKNDETQNSDEEPINLEFNGDLTGIDSYFKKNPNDYADYYSYALYEALLVSSAIPIPQVIPSYFYKSGYKNFMNFLSSKVIGLSMFEHNNEETLDGEQIAGLNEAHHAANISDLSKKIWCATNKTLCMELRDSQALNSTAQHFKTLAAKWLKEYKNYCQSQVDYKKRWCFV